MNFGDLGSHANATSRHRNFDLSLNLPQCKTHVISCNESYTPGTSRSSPLVAAAAPGTIDPERNDNNKASTPLPREIAHFCVPLSLLSSFYDLSLIRGGEG